MNVGKIRGFLLQSPKPAAVRVSREDGGEPQVLRPRNYAKTADTIAALLPDLVEVLDKDGNVVRAMRPEGVESNPSDDGGIPKALEGDPLAAAFMMYGRLLAKAYEHSTEVAFSKMVELADRMNERSDSIEKRLERSEASYRQVQQDRIDDAFDRVDEEAQRATAEAQDPLGTSITQAFIGGMMQESQKPAAEQPQTKPNGSSGHRPRKTNGHPNGKVPS